MHRQLALRAVSLLTLLAIIIGGGAGVRPF